MPSYVLPTFNVVVNVWRNGSGPPAIPVFQPLGNLSPGELNNDAEYVASPPTLHTGGMWLRLPRGTDVRDSAAPAGPDVVEVPAGSGRIYDVVWVDDIGSGFANEHRFALLAKRSPWPVPFPSGGGGGPPATPPSFVGARNQNTLGVAGQNSTLASSTKTLTNEYTVWAAYALNFTGGGPSFTLNGGAIVPTVNDPMPAGGPISGKLLCFLGTVGAGVDVLSIDYGFGNSGYIGIFVANVQNGLQVVRSATSASTNSAPPFSQGSGTPGVVNPNTVVISSVCEAAGAGAPNSYNSPMTDFLPPMLETIVGTAVYLSFAGFSNPYLGPFTSVRNGTGGATRHAIFQVLLD